MGHEVDSWIDVLNPQVVFVKSEIQPFISMTCLIQESLPKMEVPKFDANPRKLVTFTVKFIVSVYDEVFMNNNQKLIYLMQHIEVESKELLRYF